YPSAARRSGWTCMSVKWAMRKGLPFAVASSLRTNGVSAIAAPAEIAVVSTCRLDQCSVVMMFLCALARIGVTRYRASDAVDERTDFLADHPRDPRRLYLA